MPDVLELARFRVAPEKEEAFRAARPSFLAEALEKFAGLKSVQLVKLDDGSYVDVAVWESPDHCRVAMETCMDHPVIAEFLSLIDEEVSMDFGEILDGAERPAAAAAA